MRFRKKLAISKQSAKKLYKWIHSGDFGISGRNLSISSITWTVATAQMRSCLISPYVSGRIYHLIISQNLVPSEGVSQGILFYKVYLPAKHLMQFFPHIKKVL